MKDLYQEYDELAATQSSNVDAFVKSKIKAAIECLVGKSQKKDVNLDDIDITIPVSEMDEKDREEISTSLSGALCSTIDRATENLEKLSRLSEDAFNNCADKMLKDALTKCRDDIGNDEDISKEDKKSIFKSVCEWLLDCSWRETKENLSIMEKDNQDLKTASLEKVALPKGDNEITNQVVDYLNTASAYNAVISSGAILKQVNENLDSENGNQDSVEVPDIIRKAFETDILSDEEKAFKKLFALERLLTVLENFGWEVVLSPILAVRIAQDAFVYVNDAKASLKRGLAQVSSSAKEVQ